MTQTFRAGQKSKSPKTSSPVQTSQFAKRPFAEPVQQKAQQPNLQTILQRAERAGNPISEKPIQKQEESIPNQTGLPDNLKAGIENLSGYSLDDVRVHYNSPKPAQLQALAYTQGTDIHVAPGQEKHLPHEAWHVVQQMQERVKPTMQMKGVQINDNEGLEREAEMMGAKAMNDRGVQDNPGSKQAVKPREEVVERVKEAGDTPVIDTKAESKAETGVKISGLINCVGVVAKIYGNGSLDYTAVAGGHFVTPEMYEQASNRFTEAGNTFITKFQKLVPTHNPDDIDWEFYVKTPAVSGAKPASLQEAVKAATDLKIRFGGKGSIIEVSGDVDIRI
ncbi:DUF4157 domain-containing protein [Limnoraphis robusta Tam1]|uniref:eCIS core domain-containing protein n=1 Tax=Limnoraphis robusta TaxID=1118279 RepID=UPI002B1ED6BD|nr:DUF4157 domain-containing protein [Limnoraphis robusta]MEA5540749.1 DUF4157 domain-containing protein [Limnoraphis robusta Tam1]